MRETSFLHREEPLDAAALGADVVVGGLVEPGEVEVFHDGGVELDFAGIKCVVSAVWTFQFAARDRIWRGLLHDAARVAADAGRDDYKKSWRLYGATERDAQHSDGAMHGLRYCFYPCPENYHLRCDGWMSAG